MSNTILIPAEKFAGLGLHEGDQISGVVRGGVVSISVLSSDASTTMEAKQTAGSAFLGKWTGSAKALLGKDLSDDPRADYLLGR